ncbi:MAG: integrase family protein [Acidobacteriales bacterium]|nr:integrase family protein [Terriglobales bacterium]
MKRMNYQFGHIELQPRRSGPAVWVIRFRVRSAKKLTYTSRRLGTTDELPNKTRVEMAAQAARMHFNQSATIESAMTFGGLIERYKLDKLPERYSTRVSYLSCLNVHVIPAWGEYTLEQMAKAPYEVEKWFEGLKLAPKTKGHIKGLMHRLFECAMKWGLFPLGRNPMELVEIKNVSKRLRQPRVLTSDEFWNLLGHLQEPFKTMVLTAQCLGLRISEVMALRWSDFDFKALTVCVQRGIVHGRVDDVKTEYSNDDLPLDHDYAEMMLRWRDQCTETTDGWVFPNPSTLRPYWQETVAMRQIKPAAVKAGLGTGIGWHTFRHTYRTWLNAAGASMPIQKELMRHASIQTTMNIYGRSTMSEAKRAANSNVVQMALRPTSEAKSERSLAAPG